MGGLYFPWPDDNRPRVFAVWKIGADELPGLGRESDDILPRREISRELFERNPRGSDSEYATVRDGHRFYRVFRKRLLVLELPVMEW